MKKYCAWSVYIFGGWAVTLMAAHAAPPPGELQIVERGPHHRKVVHVSSLVTPDGQTVLRTNQYTELATGMHYPRNGEWLETKEVIDIVPGGALASQGPHQVGFAANINTLGAINMLTPEGKRLRSHVLGLAFTDAQTGQSVLFAPVQDSIGVLVEENQVIYSDALLADGFRADIRYTYRRNGFEQDIILRTQVPDPAIFGLTPATTRLEVFTEFVEAPAPAVIPRILSSVEEPVQRAVMAMPDFIDHQLDFGLMQVFGGRAFPVGTENQHPDETITVGKTWEVREGRLFLVEAVLYGEIKPHLDLLAAIQQPQPAAAWPAVHAGRRFPPAPRQARNETRTVRMAAAKAPASGFVIDYDIVSSASNFTFKGDTTYFMAGLMEMTGTTVFEGGAVLKYTNRTTGRPRLFVKGPVEFRTSPHLPVVFTAKDDNSFGATISGSSGTPSGLYADLALRPDNASQFFQISNIVMAYASEGIAGGSSSGSQNRFAVRNAQFFKCNFAIRTTSTNIFRNCLFSQCNSAFIVSTATNEVQNATIARCGQVASTGAGGVIYLTNSLLVANTNLTGLGGGAYNATNSTFNDVFETVGYGSHYLKDDIYRESGTASIDTQLLAMLRRKTTDAPETLTNLINGNLTLTPTARRGFDQLPALGYHYTPLDYLVSNVVVTNATLSLTNGVAVGVEYSGGSSGWGFLLKDSRFISTGDPTNQNLIVRAHMVQEQSGSNPPTRAVFYDGDSPGVSNEIRVRFTAFAQLADDGPLLSAGQKLSEMEWTHSSLHNASHVVDLTGDNIVTCGFTNTLWERGSAQFTGDGGSTNTIQVRNNLLRNCTHHFVNAQTSWRVFDNLLDGGGFDDHGTAVTNGHNAAFQATTNFAAGVNNTNLTNLVYEAGPLGRYYQPTNSPLLNTGSQNATNAALYHFTTTTNQVKETNSIVDIGLHYVALDSSSNPVDYDSDGLSDHWEDRNGNGTGDSGELSWLDWDTDDDGEGDGLELLQGRNPLGSTLADTNNILNLRVFTPLK